MLLGVALHELDEHRPHRGAAEVLELRGEPLELTLVGALTVEELLASPQELSGLAALRTIGTANSSVRSTELRIALTSSVKSRW